ncbi:MAG TPA: HAMP domain-containing sensor histidine kinase [Ktedonobacterales bacterium]|nr:HAMP domain-containing sensor histidine kinase [Ktedonobacterales bacterium]
MPDDFEYDALPTDEAGYLLVDAQWRIIAADETGTLSGDNGTTALIGQRAADILGQETVEALRRGNATTFTLENVDFVLSAVPFHLATGDVVLIRAQERQATLEHVVSLIVHEVRNPLSAMRALVQGLDEALDQDFRASPYTLRLTGEIDRLSRLLVSMAQVARLRSQPPEVMAPGVLLERVAHIYQPELARRRIQLHVQVTPRVTPIRVDADQIQQLLVNLVNNAADAMPDGGSITLRARLDPRGRPMLQVEDTGVGMTQTGLERALRPRNSSKPGGMGLGLMIVRGIVRQHQGHLKVASVPGKGTTISVTFPAAPDQSAAEEA